MAVIEPSRMSVRLGQAQTFWTATTRRIVFGVGTRAVERADDDYTRVVALNAPACRPESGSDEVRRTRPRDRDRIGPV